MELNLHNRRAIKNGNIGDLTDEQFRIAKEYFGIDRCAYSGREKLSVNNMSLEHIIPISSGGDSSMWNCIPVGNKINEEKSGYHILDWYEDEGEKYYNPYRLLKIVNYILKVIENREIISENNLEEMRRTIIKDRNMVDEYLIKNKDKVYSRKKSDDSVTQDEELELENLFGDVQGYDVPKISQHEFLMDLINKLEKNKAIKNIIIKFLKDKVEKLTKQGVLAGEGKTEKLRRLLIDKCEELGLKKKYGIATAIASGADANRLAENELADRASILCDEISKKSELLKMLQLSDKVKKYILAYVPVEELKDKLELLKGIQINHKSQAHILAYMPVKELQEKLESVKDGKLNIKKMLFSEVTKLDRREVVNATRDTTYSDISAVSSELLKSPKAKEGVTIGR